MTTLPLDFARQRTRSANPGYRESQRLHDAIVLLRGVGFRVYAQGGQHKVNGRLLSDAELLRLAAQYRAEAS